MWKLLSESVEGTSHRRSAQPCQDFCRAEQVRMEHGTFVVLACADGAGSATYAKEGARLACNRFFELTYEFFKAGGDLASVDREATLRWYDDVRDKIHQLASSRKEQPREFACTLLTAVISEGHATFAQVGDGTIVRSDDGVYESVFWPQNGEYANLTNFVTQERIDSVFEFTSETKAIQEVALLTDGLQRLVLDFASKTVHQAFFKPFFTALGNVEHADELVVPLRGFLDSPNVNERTDDDKTLILAARVRGNVAG